MKIAEGFGGSAEADNEMKKRQIASRAPGAPIGASYISSLLVFTDGAKQEGAKRFTAADRKKKTLTAGLCLPRLMTRRRAH